MKKKMILQLVLSGLVMIAILVMPASVLAVTDRDVSSGTDETVSALGCDAYIQIDDPCCNGYCVYVDGAYKLTEGGSGNPDGFCAFYVCAGTHTIKITKNGRAASITKCFQSGSTYSWVSMPYCWCDYHHEPTPDHCQVYIEVQDPCCKGYCVYVDGTYILTEGASGNPDGYCAFYVREGTHKFELRKGGYTTSKSWYCHCGTDYSWVSMPCGWCANGNCQVYVQVDDNTCVGYDVYVDGVYILTEGASGNPDGYCAFYVREGTHKFELRKGGYTTSKSWYCHCGTDYSWVSMPDYWCRDAYEHPPYEGGTGDSDEDIRLDVPFFSQRDSKWKDKKLDHSPYSLGKYGCALTSAAMVAKYFGSDTDPDKLNTRLTAVGGLDTSGIIHWKKVEDVSNGKVAWRESVGASWSRIDQELSSENPVISSVNCPLGLHFIVFVGKSGDEHYFLDPYDKQRIIRTWPNGAHGEYTLINLKIYHGSPNTFVPSTLKVLIGTGSVVTMDLEEYVKGVVAAEMYPSWPIEALKAQAVASRTFAIANTHHDHINVDVCTDYHCCQAWVAGPYDENVEKAVTETHNEVLKYNGQIVKEALFFAHCNGHTCNSEDYCPGGHCWDYMPYLRSVPCDCGFSAYYGSGVGMCQQGAKSMAEQGYSYVDILKHYYTGIEVASSSPAPAEQPFLSFSDNFNTDSGEWTYVETVYNVDTGEKCPGSAYRDLGNEYLVLTNSGYQAGVIWFNRDIFSPFTAEFRYKAGSGTGADGLVFMFYKQRDYDPYNGGCLGFTTPPGGSSSSTPVPGYGIEFDNFNNGFDGGTEQFDDPSGNHIAIIKDSVDNHIKYVDDPRTEDDRWHNVKIIVGHSTIEVYVDSELVLRWEGKIDRTYGGLGFSGATGYYDYWHIIDDVKILV